MSDGGESDSLLVVSSLRPIFKKHAVSDIGSGYLCLDAAFVFLKIPTSCLVSYSHTVLTEIHRQVFDQVILDAHTAILLQYFWMGRSGGM